MFIRNKKLLIAAVFTLLIGVSLLMSLLGNREAATEEKEPVFIINREEVKTKNWDDIEVGKDKFDSVKNDYGTVLKETELESGKTLHEMNWKGKYIPLIIGTDADDTVSFVEVSQALIEKPATYEGLLNQYSLSNEPDINLYVPGSVHTQVAVYLDEGVAFEYQTVNKEVLTVMYFTPVSRNVFLETWGAKFSTKPIEPGN